ncbi:MAG: shikimate kinase [Treponema sp.]|nr:shikimate kinase [Treponema sp.]
MTKDVIILLGLKHSGKTTLGKELAKKLGYDFVDTDELIEETVGMSVRDLYNNQGPQAFILAEETVCKKLTANIGDKKMVISTGGGICENPPALMHLKAAGEFVFLKNDLKLSVSRIMKKIDVDETGSFTNVPAFIKKQNPKSLEDIKKMLYAKFNERAELYQKISDTIVELENASIEENLECLYKSIK